MPRAFPTQNLRDPGKARPGAWAKKLQRWAEPCTVFPVAVWQGEDTGPDTHLPSGLKNRASPLLAWGAGKRASSLHLLYPPCRLQDLNQGPPPPWVKDQRVEVTPGDPAAGWA